MSWFWWAFCFYEVNSHQVIWKLFYFWLMHFYPVMQIHWNIVIISQLHRGQFDESLLESYWHHVPFKENHFASSFILHSKYRGYISLQWLHTSHWLRFFFSFCYYSSNHLSLKEKMMKSDQIPMSQSIQLLNYFSVSIHPSTKMSGLQSIIVICWAFYHACFSTFEAIANAIFLLTEPSGENWWL